ncbi:hypothetical protein TEA_014004 [Camellia sinensis var. sinensis]|uniref:Uncharacterized protein n=1 Tax=Camellia sinensis var. sinensis TaxID=542762 RepID=A0A4V3WP55_CAMSN|nr:hypothetical protein TEA_014004 [Camellia sinensis var. sinensis]
MRTGYKEQPKNAWKTKGLALPTIFAIDEFFRHNEDTKWAVKELERRELVGLFGPFLKVYPCLVRLFYQNMHKQYRFPNVLYTVLDGDLHGDLSPEAIVNDMCKGHFGSDHQSTCRVHLPPQMWLIDSIFHLSGHKDECQGHYLKAFYKIEKGYWVSVPDLIWAEMDKLHKGLVVTQTQKSESWALPFPSLITKLLLDQGFPIDTDEIVVNERVGMYACPSSCAYSTGTAPAPFQMTSEQYEQLCQEVRGLRQDVIAYRTQSQQDFLEFRSQYQQDMLDLRSLLQAILDAQQRPPRMDKLHKGLVVTQTQKSESWVLPFPSLITKLLLDQGFPIDTDEIVVNERVGMYACPSSCAYSSGTAPAPFQMTSEQYEQLCQEVRGLWQDIIAYLELLWWDSSLMAFFRSLRSLDDRVAIGLQEQEGKLSFSTFLPGRGEQKQN